MLTLVGVVVAPRGLPVTSKLLLPAATEEPTLTVRSLLTPAEVGVTGLTVNDPHLIPEGRVEPTHDIVTGCAVPAVRITVILTG